MNPFKYLLCSWFCPEFKKRIPEKQTGKYIAEVFTGSVFGNSSTKYKRLFNCKRKAYFAARWEALKLDFSMPDYEGVGIKWSVYESRK
jgi:hypothetical protein